MLLLWARIAELALLCFWETVDYFVGSKGLTRHAWVWNESISVTDAVHNWTRAMRQPLARILSRLTSAGPAGSAKAAPDRGEPHAHWSRGVALHAVVLSSVWDLALECAPNRWLAEHFVNASSAVLYLRSQNWQAFTHTVPSKRLDVDSNLWKAVLGTFFLNPAHRHS